MIVLHLLMMASLYWGYLNPLFDNSDQLWQALDFYSIYEAGHRALENESVYTTDESSPSEVPYYTDYRYVPLFAYGLGVPLNIAPAPSWWGYWGWVVFYELLLLANAYVTWRIAGRGTWGVIAAAMWFLFTPFYVEQFMGQFSFLMATALFWTGIGIVRGREALAGSAWAASLITKSNTALLAPLFLRAGWWRSLVGAGALFGANMLYFAWHWSDLKYFFKANVGNVFDGTVNRYFDYDPGELGAVALIRNVQLAMDDDALTLPIAYAVTLVLVVAVLSLAATFAPRRPDPLALFAIWVLAFFLSYIVWEHHYVMVLPVLVLLVAFRPSLRLLTLVVFVLLALPTPYWLLDHVWNTAPLPERDTLLTHQEAWPLWGVILHHAIKPLPVAVLWACLVAFQFRSGVRVPWAPRMARPRFVPAPLRVAYRVGGPAAARARQEPHDS